MKSNLRIFKLDGVEVHEYTWAKPPTDFNQGVQQYEIARQVHRAIVKPRQLPYGYETFITFNKYEAKNIVRECLQNVLTVSVRMRTRAGEMYWQPFHDRQLIDDVLRSIRDIEMEQDLANAPYEGKSYVNTNWEKSEYNRKLRRAIDQLHKGDDHMAAGGINFIVGRKEFNVRINTLTGEVQTTRVLPQIKRQSAKNGDLAEVAVDISGGIAEIGVATIGGELSKTLVMNGDAVAATIEGDTATVNGTTLTFTSDGTTYVDATSDDDTEVRFDASAQGKDVKT